MATTAEDRAMIEALHEAARDMDIELDLLQVDLSYQRNPSRDIVEKIAHDYDPIANEQILVSYRGERPEKSKTKGGYFIINGQHRTLAAKGLGHKTISARMIDLSAEKDPGRIEAQLRLKTNVKLADSSLERFKAQLRAGDPDSIAIQKLLGRYDTQINSVADVAFGINCVSAIENLYFIDEGSLLTDTLDVMKEVYEEIRGPVANANLFKGVAWFTEAHSEKADRGRLVSQMQKMSVAQLMARARFHASVMGNSLWFNLYRAIVELYNEKLSQGQKLEFISKGATKISRKAGQSFQ